MPYRDLRPRVTIRDTACTAVCGTAASTPCGAVASRPLPLPSSSPPFTAVFAVNGRARSAKTGIGRVQFASRSPNVTAHRYKGLLRGRVGFDMAWAGDPQSEAAQALQTLPAPLGGHRVARDLGDPGRHLGPTPPLSIRAGFLHCLHECRLLRRRQQRSMPPVVMPSVADPVGSACVVALGQLADPGQRVARGLRHLLAGRSSGQQPDDLPLTPLRSTPSRPARYHCSSSSLDTCHSMLSHLLMPLVYTGFDTTCRSRARRARDLTPVTRHRAGRVEPSDGAPPDRQRCLDRAHPGTGRAAAAAHALSRWLPHARTQQQPSASGFSALSFRSAELDSQCEPPRALVIPGGRQ